MKSIYGTTKEQDALFIAALIINAIVRLEDDCYNVYVPVNTSNTDIRNAMNAFYSK